MNLMVFRFFRKSHRRSISDRFLTQKWSPKSTKISQKIKQYSFLRHPGALREHSGILKCLAGVSEVNFGAPGPLQESILALPGPIFDPPGPILELPRPIFEPPGPILELRDSNWESLGMVSGLQTGCWDVLEGLLGLQAIS